MRRETVIAFCSKLLTCVIAMEAFCGAYHMGRALVAQGHAVRLMSPEYVWPHVKAQKNDDHAAEAIAEPATQAVRLLPHSQERELSAHDTRTYHSKDCLECRSARGASGREWASSRRRSACLFR